MKHAFALKSPPPVNGKGGQRGNTNSRKDSHGSADMKTMDMVLRARCKRMGWRPTDANLRTAKAPHLGSECGIAIHLEEIRTETAFNQDRWAACEDIRKTFHGYWSLIGKSPFPQNAAIQILSDEVFSDPDARAKEDLTDEQKASRFTAIANRKQRLITWIATGAGVHASQFTDVITLDRAAKAGFIGHLDQVMKAMDNGRA